MQRDARDYHDIDLVHAPSLNLAEIRALNRAPWWTADASNHELRETGRQCFAFSHKSVSRRPVNYHQLRVRGPDSVF